jgi:DnaK suppressor protein
VIQQTDDAEILRKLSLEETRIRSLIEKMERGGVVTHTGAREHLGPLEDTSMDAGSEVAEREFELNILQDLASELEAIDRARERLRLGTFGLCLKCGQRIAADRLEAVVFAERCTEHQQ